jgi:uncharacterized protein (DUF2147 family)
MNKKGMAAFSMLLCALLWLEPSLAAEQSDAPAPASAESIVGTWLVEGGQSKVAITAQDGTFVGRVVWLKEPERDGKPLLDAKNEDPSLRGRPVMGLEVLSNFRYQGDGQWTGGEIYAPGRGKRYSAAISLTSHSRLNLAVEAGFITKNETWSR